ncbi:hypothetical protein OIU76_007420 [Salix suchowensis]|nr:hypothetical protein OIU76_007420 [Salix suchowensis]
MSWAKPASALKSRGAVEIACACARVANNPQFSGGGQEKERTKKDETDNENVDASDVNGHKEDKKREKDKDRKHRKRHQRATDDANSDKDDGEIRQFLSPFLFRLSLQMHRLEMRIS